MRTGRLGRLAAGAPRGRREPWLTAAHPGMHKPCYQPTQRTRKHRQLVQEMARQSNRQFTTEGRTGLQVPGHVIPMRGTRDLEREG